MTIRTCPVMLLALLVAALPAAADVSLPAVVGSNMVLQRDMPIHIWGWAQAGEEVTVQLASQKATARADKDGNWSVTLQAMKASSDPLEMTVAGKNTLKLTNILVGEVWICSGQSNMEMAVISCRVASQELAASDIPNLRLFAVTKNPSPVPMRDVIGSWAPSSPQTAATFSAVGYFFGRDLHRDLKVPVGIIHSSWGGTAVEVWISPEVLSKFDWMKPQMEQYKAAITPEIASLRTPQQLMAVREKITAEWLLKHRHQDPGNKGFAQGYAAPETAETDWKDMALPQVWQNAGLKMNGAVWFRKTIELPPALAGKELTLNLGILDDFDTTYFNGRLVGSMDQTMPNTWATPRTYKVPGELVKAGKNVIATRVFDWAGTGGFSGKADQMTLESTSKESPAIPLSGTWKYKIELELPYLEFASPPGQWPSPGGLYNGMIAPLTPLAIRGALWYQGESNADNAMRYRQTFPALIQDWRTQWKQPDMPFLFVQLANFMGRADQPGESQWAELREAQTLTLNTPNTGMAVAIDIGDAEDIHPKDKQNVGYRLEQAALAQTYGRDIEYSGPLYKSMKVEGDRIRVEFDHTRGGLMAPGSVLTGFAIAGADGKFVWAHAEIEGQSVVVWSKQVPQPKAVRYAWGDNPACNLYNKARLPASPFRTDVP